MILQVPQLPFTLILFVPSAQTQAEVGDAKPISQMTNGFGFINPGVAFIYLPPNYEDRRCTDPEIIVYTMIYENNFCRSSNIEE